MAKRFPRAISTTVRRFIRRHERDADVYLRTEFDKARWTAKVADDMAREEPAVHAFIGSQSRSDWYAGQVDSHIRWSRSPETRGHRDLRDVVRRAKRGREKVAVPQPDGSYVSKYLRDCTALDLDGLALYHEAKGNQHLARAERYRLLARQLRLAGLDDDQTVADLVV